MKSLLASLGIAAVAVAATSFGVKADNNFTRGRSSDIIKSQPAMPSNSAQKYRPKRGCFATGTLDASGNSQLVC